MGSSDAYVRGLVGPRLRAGEEIWSIGAVVRYGTHNLVGNPVGSGLAHLAVATSQRLFLFAVGGSGARPSPPATSEECWEYRDLLNVRTEHVGGFLDQTRVTIVPRGATGPHGGKGTMLYLPREAEGLPDHGRFCREFFGWLAPRVTSGELASGAALAPASTGAAPPGASQVYPRGPKGRVRTFGEFHGALALTLGAYLGYWFVTVSREVNAFLGEERMSGVKILAATVLTLGAYQMYFQFIEAPRIIAQLRARAGLAIRSPPALMPWRFQRELNEVWLSLP